MVVAFRVLLNRFMNYKLGWIGGASFHAFTPEHRELVFDLAEGRTGLKSSKKAMKLTSSITPTML
jgi:hypothetical protein